jgi:hypothetical protein
LFPDLGEDVNAILSALIGLDPHPFWFTGAGYPSLFNGRNAVPAFPLYCIHPLATHPLRRLAGRFHMFSRGMTIISMGFYFMV